MPEITCESRITHVAVYARGAVVTRSVALPSSLPEEPFDLLLTKISPLAEAGSFRVELLGEREVLGLRSELLIPASPVASGALRERVKELTLAREALTEEREEKERRRAWLSSLLPAPPRRTRWRTPDPKKSARDSLAVSGLLLSLIASLDEALITLGEFLQENARALDAASLAAAQAKSADLAGEGHPTRQVSVQLSEGKEIRSLQLSYLVGGARWWPAYSARLTEGARRANLAIEAFVAQVSGEDWKDALISLVTADLVHDARLPELPSLRLGRAQPPKAKGFRPPPPGLDALFTNYDQAVAGLSVQAPPATTISTEETPALESLAGELDEDAFAFDRLQQERPKTESRRTERAPYGRGGQRLDDVRARMSETLEQGRMAPPEPEIFDAPYPQREMMVAPQAAARKSGGLLSGLLSLGGGGGGMPGPPAAMSQSLPAGRLQKRSAGPTGGEALLPIEPADAWLDFDSLRLGGPDEAGRRGRLFRSGSQRPAGSLASKMPSLEEIPPPWRTRDPLVSRGLFDARYDAAGECDIPSDARAHRILLRSAQAPATPAFRTVPRASPEVYRQTELENPFGLPLLAGPVEIFVDGALLTTTELSPVDKGGKIILGLGVEERLRVARNARMEETSAGLLGGTAVLDHSVSIELASALGHPVVVQVLDRYPISDEKTVEISLLASSPEHKSYDQAELGQPVRGGLSWKVQLAPGEKTRVSFSYRISIPAKNEISGGNRREE